MVRRVGFHRGRFPGGPATVDEARNPAGEPPPGPACRYASSYRAGSRRTFFPDSLSTNRGARAARLDPGRTQGAGVARGHEIRADYDRATLVVYQAYSPAITDAALRERRFVPPFSFTRMTWIKPS